MIRSADPADAPVLCALYNHYIKSSIVTFEEEPVSVDDFRHRIETILEAYEIGGKKYADKLYSLQK